MKNWSLNAKVWGVVGVLSVAYAISFTISFYSGKKNIEALDNITNVLNKRMSFIVAARNDQRSIIVNSLKVMVFEKPELIKQYTDRYHKSVEDLKHNLDGYYEIGSPEGRAIIDEYRATFKTFHERAQAIMDAKANNKSISEMANILSSNEADNEKMLANMKAMVDLTNGRMDKASREAQKFAEESTMFNVVFSAVAIFFSLLVAFFVLRALTKAIDAIIQQLTQGSEQVSSASTQIASASEELSQATTEQAASLEETAASVEEMSSMVQKNTENAGTASTAAQQSLNATEKGQAVVTKMLTAMNGIDQSNATIMEQVNASNAQVAGIVKVVEQIAKKTQVINEIVNKTELLSFNASVEAARAGEHGKGFAVVAEEVGNLARMSGTAAEEITTLIEGSIESVNKIVQETGAKVSALIQSGKQSVDEGTKVAQECNEILKDISHEVNRVTSMSGEIASASNEQSRGISEISKAMNQLDQMTQQNAATSEEAASAAEELAAQAEVLSGTVAQLLSTVKGGSSQAQQKTEPKVTRSQSTQASASHKAKLEKVKSAKTKKESDNVVHLKSKSSQKSSEGNPARTASGEVPSYDHDGFSDV